MLEDVKNIITILGITAAGIWTYYRFGINRERHPKLQFDLDMEVLGKTDKQILVQLIAIVQNKGLTRQYIHDFKFSLLYFNSQLPVNCDNKEINHQVEFTPLFKSRNWLTQKSSKVFVDGNITHRFTYNTLIPVDAEYVMIYSKFNDPQKRLFKKSTDLYHISKTFNLKKIDRT